MPTKSKIPNRVEVGQLFKCHTSFFANEKDWGRRRKTEILEGDILEIRYAFAWHFRVVGVGYLQCSEDDLLSNCDLFGIIHEDVRFKNKSDLSEILDNKLYYRITDIIFNTEGKQ